ncbi:hypothetical protein [Nocardia transvalensis]|uniref:hypothetical protein n=1 Tax=Nocardia transvalensis TaxID=37333 RepID=UPI001894F6EA|nr:hypothetical protein [Nocardia transvalensis]MBF6333158.1 hypothetical protein [Nocardia transvalensis]
MPDPLKEVRRALTETEISALAEGIASATSMAELVDAAVRGLFDTLLADHGNRFDDFDRDNPLDPGRFAIPTTQWQALAGAVTSRADQWGAAITIGLELVNIWPSTFEDPAVPEPQLTVVDRRPHQFDIHVSRDAADEIAKCEDHLSSLADYYGPTSTHYLDAMRSWHSLVVGLFTTRRGADTTVTRDGRLSLLVSCDHLIYAAVFHGWRRNCTDPACHATASDDGSWRKPYDDAPILDHAHTPSYPFDAPQPGAWSFHS